MVRLLRGCSTGLRSSFPSLNCLLTFSHECHVPPANPGDKETVIPWTDLSYLANIHAAHNDILETNQEPDGKPTNKKRQKAKPNQHGQITKQVNKFKSRNANSRTQTKHRKRDLWSCLYGVYNGTVKLVWDQFKNSTNGLDISRLGNSDSKAVGKHQYQHGKLNQGIRKLRFQHFAEKNESITFTVDI